MANIKITELPAITSSSDLAASDVIPVVDVNEEATSKVSLSVLCTFFGAGGGGSSIWCTGTNIAYLLTDCVGIGTATPGTDIMLRVQGDSCYTGDLKIGGDVCIGGDDLFMGTNTSGHMLIADGTNFNPVAMSGDVGIDSAGATTIQATSVENSMLAGSIANAKLSNSSVSYGGISLALGATDATPAFNLCDATAYPTSSLVGTITNAQLAGSIANDKLSNSAITVSDGSNTTAISLGGTMTFSGTSNEVEVAESSGTVTIGLPATVSGLTHVSATCLTGTLQTVAQANVTSVGTLTALTVDNICLDGATIGHTSDTDLLTLANGSVTIAGDLTISGDDLTMGTNTSGHILVADGTNYNPVAVSGDVSINSSGAVTIAATSVENSMLAGSIANAKLANDSVSYGGISVDLGSSDATPAFNLCDATAYKTTNLVGTITNTQLAGSIDNSKLSNSSVSYGGVSVSLGSTDATPAFNLCDATAYKGDSALVTVGTVTSGTWQGTAIATAYIAGTICDKTLASPVLCGTITGNAFLDEDNMASDSASKVASQQSIKAYVDSVASGLDLKCSSHAATTANLSAAYNNGTSGVGATLTNNSTQAALSVDGQTMAAAERVLVKDQSTAAQNGIYTVTTVGDGSSNWVITRATDFDTATEITSGAFTFVETGTSLADSGWVMTTDGTVTVGTTSLAWSQFSGAGQITAGDGMTKSGNTLNVGAGSNLLVNADAVAMCAIVTGLTTVCATNFAGTLATAAQANVTSLGTLTALTVDNVCLNGATIGHTSDTDLITLADGSVTIAGDLTVSGDDLTMGTNTSGYLLVADGTNYNPVAMSGDVAITSSGATTIQATSVDNSMLAGSIANAKLSNSSVSYGGISLSLGGTDATPAFNLCDATAYKGDSALVTSGALNSGSITSGFGNIDNGSSTITTTGALSAGATTIGGTLDFNSGTIDLSTQTVDVTLNAAVDALNFDSNTLSIDATNNRVGIGEAAPGALLHLKKNNGSAAIRLEREDTSVSSGNEIGGLIMTGGESSADTPVARIVTYADDTWTSSSSPTRIEFEVTPSGATADVLAMTLDSTGYLGIGTTAPAQLLHLSGAATAPQILIEDTGNNTATLTLDGDRNGENQETGKIFFNWNNNNIAKIAGLAGPDTTNKDDGKLSFQTAAAGGTMTERMLIDESGNINIAGLSASSDVQTDGSKNLVTTSDERLKNADGFIENALSTIEQLTPRYFFWKHDVANGVEARQLGFFSQEVHALIPEAAPVEDDIWGLNTRAIVAYLTAAVQELSAKINKLEG